MKYSLASVLLAVEAVVAYPFVAEMPGVDSSLFRTRQQPGDPSSPGSFEQCPKGDGNHIPAAAFNTKYPYNYADFPRSGRGKGGYQVPAPGDTDHAFIPPKSTDIRGPCPGLNTAANHNFLARDGITTFKELVDAQQNLYNVGSDLANLLALLGLTTTDGDLVTGKLSIGCDATDRTSFNPKLTGSEPGLAGHNKFEADTSLTRNDFFTHGGDNFKLNLTLFQMMDETCDGNFNRENLALYRKQRYDQSLAENPNFYFGPFSLLLFGASSFLYELMPSGPDYNPDLKTISSFFGVTKNDDGTYSKSEGERIPENWTNRIEPYSNRLVVQEILAQYLLHPVLFGGATGNGGFNGLNFGAIKDGKLPVGISLDNTLCLVYQLVSERIPSYLNGLVTPLLNVVNFLAQVTGIIGLKNLGCPQALT